MLTYQIKIWRCLHPNNVHLIMSRRDYEHDRNNLEHEHMLGHFFATVNRLLTTQTAILSHWKFVGWLNLLVVKQ